MAGKREYYSKGAITMYDKNLPNGGGTNIWVPNEIKNELNKYKIHPRETYWSVIRRLLECHDTI